jgi:general secretion pathway protein G
MIQRSIAKKRSGQGGFTLIELLIVIVILGILAAIVVLAIGGLSGKSKQSACNAESKTIQTAEDAYYASSADAQGNNATYGTEAQLYTGNSATSLLKTNPFGDDNHFHITNVTDTGYTLTGLNNCASLGAVNLP